MNFFINLFIIKKINLNCYILPFAKKAFYISSPNILAVLVSTILIVQYCISTYNQVNWVINLFSFSNYFILINVLLLLSKNNIYYFWFIEQVKHMFKSCILYIYTGINKQWEYDFAGALLLIQSKYPKALILTYYGEIMFIIILLCNFHVCSLLLFIAMNLGIIIFIHYTYINTYLKCNRSWIYKILAVFLVFFIIVTLGLLLHYFVVSSYIWWVGSPSNNNDGNGSGSSSNKNSSPKGPKGPEGTHNIDDSSVKKRKAVTQEEDEDADFCQPRVRMTANKKQFAQEKKEYDKLRDHWDKKDSDEKQPKLTFRQYLDDLESANGKDYLDPDCMVTPVKRALADRAQTIKFSNDTGLRRQLSDYYYKVWSGLSQEIKDRLDYNKDALDREKFNKERSNERRIAKLALEKETQCRATCVEANKDV